MKHVILGLTATVALAGVSAAQSQNPALRPGTHIDSTIVGDTRSESTPESGYGGGLNNDHHFEAGAPDLNEIAPSLDLSTRQKAQLHDIIERGDAGAADLIKRERDVKEMLVRTPADEDPRRAELLAEQADAQSRWQSARDSVHQEVVAILTPAQQAKYDQLRTAQQSPPNQ